MKTSSLLLMLAVIVTMQFGFNNCAPIHTIDNAGEFASEAPLDSSGGDFMGTDEKPTELNEKVLVADGINRSFAALTGVNVGDTNVAKEYATRATVFPDTFELKNITSPMLFGVTNLAGRYCEQALVKEVPMTATARRLFGQIDFTKSIDGNGDWNFDFLAQNLSQKFWGRMLSAEESDLIRTARWDFITALGTTSGTSTASTRNLALFTCTAMLSSMDSFTF